MNLQNNVPLYIPLVIGIMYSCECNANENRLITHWLMLHLPAVCRWIVWITYMYMPWLYFVSFVNDERHVLTATAWKKWSVWMIDRLSDWSIDWSIDWTLARLTGWLTDWLFVDGERHMLTLTAWNNGLFVWMIDRLSDWLIDWSIDQ